MIISLETAARHPVFGLKNGHTGPYCKWFDLGLGPWTRSMLVVGPTPNTTGSAGCRCSMGSVGSVPRSVAPCKSFPRDLPPVVANLRKLGEQWAQGDTAHNCNKWLSWSHLSFSSISLDICINFSQPSCPQGKKNRNYTQKRNHGFWFSWTTVHVLGYSKGNIEYLITGQACRLNIGVLRPSLRILSPSDNGFSILQFMFSTSSCTQQQIHRLAL